MKLLHRLHLPMAGMASNSNGFSMSVKRFMQRQNYRKLDEVNRGRKRLRIVKLGSRKGFVWKPKLRLRIIKSAVKGSAKSWLGKIRDVYVGLMVNLAQYRIRKPPAKVPVRDFNDKIIAEICKSVGVQVQFLPDQAESLRSSSVRTITV